MATARTPSGICFTPPSSREDADKKIVFVRHGCTYMNEHLGRSLSFGAPKFTDIFDDKERDAYYMDSPLSPRGVRQAQNLLAKSRPSFVDDCELVVTSPLTRALQTFEIGLKHHFTDSIPVVAVPHAAERLYLVSDIGKKRSYLESKYSYVDFKTCFNDHGEEWWYTPLGGTSTGYTEWRPTGQGQRYACPGEPYQDFNERMAKLVSWLDEREEQKIVVVCHHGVIDWMLGLDFDNCQWREVSLSLLKDRVAKATRNAKQT